LFYETQTPFLFVCIDFHILLMLNSEGAKLHIFFRKTEKFR